MRRAWPASSDAPEPRVEILLALVVVAVVVWFVSGPLRRTPGETEAAAERLEDPRVAELEARKEAKYREIRDAELDREQGKLSQADWSRQDAELRREAIEILKLLDQARAEAANGRPTQGADRPAA
jgi:flagellar biosynthesis/type III secretory pathway M-ring protein FliF/YscJ